MGGGDDIGQIATAAFAAGVGGARDARGKVVADLDEPEERMLTLLFREELTLHEVADRLGISYQAAWCRNTRLLKRLRDKLARLGLIQAPEPIGARLPGTGPPRLHVLPK